MGFNPLQFLNMDRTETLIKIIKQQAEVFLLDAREFLPFGTYINGKNEMVPLGAYIEDVNDRPKSQSLIDMLERGIRTRMNDGECIIGALVFDVLISENQQKFDAIMIRIFENDNFVEKPFKYYIHENHVEFV